MWKLYWGWGMEYRYTLPFTLKMVILSVCFAITGIVIRWTGSSVTWTPPLKNRQLTRRGRSEHVHRQQTHHVDHFEIVICRS